MATRILQFKCAIPANTLVTAPVSIPLSMDNWVVERIDLDVPPGPAGLMGFQIYNNGVAWIPYGDGEWIVWDDVKDTYYLTDQPTASGWSLEGYNTDASYSHAVTLRFHVSVPTAATVTEIVVPTIITTAAPESEVMTL